jgi:hypothetical protein
VNHGNASLCINEFICANAKRVADRSEFVRVHGALAAHHCAENLGGNICTPCNYAVLDAAHIHITADLLIYLQRNPPFKKSSVAGIEYSVTQQSWNVKCKIQKNWNKFPETLEKILDMLFWDCYNDIGDENEKDDRKQD